MNADENMITVSSKTKRLPLQEFSSSRINKLGSTPQKSIAKTKLPSIKALIDYAPQDAILLSPESASAQVLPIGTPKDSKSSQELANVSERLRVRLQFAYYKLRTNRAHATFKELKSQLEVPATRPGSRKRRKLVVSQGNYKASLKPTEIRTESQGFLHFSDHSTASIHATPRTKHQRSLSTLQKQNTPMSVKAAKSLLHLFTSNQH